MAGRTVTCTAATWMAATRGSPCVPQKIIRIDRHQHVPCACLHRRVIGTPWIIGGDLATLYPFLAFRLPRVRYARRWLTVDAGDSRKRQHTGGGSRAEATDDSGRNGGGSHESSDSLDGFTDCGVSSTAEGGEEGEGVEGADVKADDREAVALDIALPEKGLDPAKPFYLVLHGLTGGSAEVCIAFARVRMCSSLLLHNIAVCVRLCIGICVVNREGF